MAENVEKIISIQLKANDAINGLKDLNAQIDANKTRMKELAAANQKGSAEYAKLEQQTKALSQTKQYLSKETQNEIKLEYEEEGSLRKLRAELSKATQEFDKLSRAERENGARGKELKAQINSLTNEIKAAEEGTQRYYRNVGNYQNAILNAVGLNGRFGQSIMALTNMEGTMTSSFSAMGSSIKAFGASLMGLLTNPVFLAIAGIAGVGLAFKWFYDYNEGLAEATRLTKEFTGYMGDDLTVIRDKIQATADVMDKDFKETLQACDAIMANFHVNGEQAMDIINQGFAAGADVNGDFLAKVQQLAPTFHDAGISAEQMVAIISQTKSGIFTDQGLEAIKQGSARIREMSNTTRQALQNIGIDVNAMQAKLRDGSMTTFEALQQVSAQLKTLPDNAQEVGEVMSAVFGRQGKFASQEMIESLADMSTSLDEAQAKTGEYGELLLENINTEEELNNVTAAMFDMTQNGWEETKQAAIIYCKKGLVAVVKGIIDVINWYVRLYNRSLAVRAVTNYIVTGYKLMWNAAKLAFNLIIDGIKGVGRGLDAMVTWFSSVGKAISSFGQGVYKILHGIATRSLEEVKAGYNMISRGVSANIKTGIQSIVSAWSESINEVGGDLKAWGGEMADIVMEGFYNTIDSHMEEIKMPTFSGGGGGNGGNGGNGGGGGNGGTGHSGGSGSGSGSGSSNSGEDTKSKLERLAKELQNEADRVRQKSLREMAKVDEDKIKEMYAEQIKSVKDKYKELLTATGQFSAAQLLDFQNNLNEIVKGLEKQRDDAIRDLRTAQANQKLQNEIDASNDPKKKHELELQQLDNKQKAELEKIVNNEELKNSVIAKYEKMRADMRTKFAKEQLDAQQKLAQTLLDSLGNENTALEKRLEFELELLNIQKEQELAQYTNNLEMRSAIELKYLRKSQELQQEYAGKEREIQYQRYEAIAAVTGGMGQLMAEFQDDNKSALIASKILALGEIMISQAVAIANAVKAGSNAVSPWQMIAQIAASVTAVTVAMAQAFKSLNQAKFATGGYVRGAGTGTSDSIPVRVSNGESIMNANTTAMFGGLLSSLNQLGGGVPIQAQETASSVRGEDMLARAVARGVAMLPAPVVSVEDINRGQRQVEVMNEQATL